MKRMLAISIVALVSAACSTNVLDVGGNGPEEKHWQEPELLTLANSQCLPPATTPLPDFSVPCVIIEARRLEGACVCDGPARRPVTEEHGSVLELISDHKLAGAAGWNCFCEDVQLGGSDREKCQNDPTEPDVDGWCYVDATTTPATGNPELVSTCPEAERRMLRFIGEGLPLEGASSFFACLSEDDASAGGT